MTRLFCVLLLSAIGCLAQPTAIPQRTKWLEFDYPADQVPKMFFWWDKSTNDVSEVSWQTMATIGVPDLDTGSMVAFYRVGADWRTNAPPWFTNFQIRFVTNTVYKFIYTNAYAPPTSIRSAIKPLPKQGNVPRLK